ncbi:MAG: hypothetical protein AABZ53_15350 [Planctomycetota bacterium]
MMMPRPRILAGWLLLTAATLCILLGLIGLGSVWRSVVVQWNGNAAGASEGVLIGSSYFASANPPMRGFEVNSKPRTHPFVWWIESDPIWQIRCGAFSAQRINGFGIQSRTVMVIWWLPLLVGGAGLLAGWLVVRKGRRRLRNGQCIDCGYSMAGLPADTPCPECGAKGAITTH